MGAQIILQNLNLSCGWYKLVWQNDAQIADHVEAWLIPKNDIFPQIFVIFESNELNKKTATVRLVEEISNIEFHIFSQQTVTIDNRFKIIPVGMYSRINLYFNKLKEIINQCGILSAFKLTWLKYREFQSYKNNLTISNVTILRDVSPQYTDWQEIYEPWKNEFFLSLPVKLLVVHSSQLSEDASIYDTKINIIYFNIPHEFSTALLLSTLKFHNADYFLFLPENGQFRSGTLETMIAHLQKTQANSVYTDHDIVNRDGVRHTPHFKPQWSPIRFKNHDYIGEPVIFATSALDNVPNDVKLNANNILKCLNKKIEHLPFIGFHSTITKNLLPVQYAPKTYAKIDIIIPTRDNIAYLKPCIESILQHSVGQNYHITIINNNSVQPETFDLFETYKKLPKISVIDDSSPYNFSALNNNARKIVTGEVLVFLNNDTEVLTDNWLDELAYFALMPRVGAVGALLLYPNGSIQHAGIALGICGSSGHVYRHQNPELQAPLYDLQTRREVSAVTGACLAISAQNFDLVGGFDEQLDIEYNDLDLCLRLNNLGKQTIFTPHVRVTHHESITRGRVHNSKNTELFQKRWLKTIQNDMYYNPNFTRASENNTLRV